MFNLKWLPELRRVGGALCAVLLLAALPSCDVVGAEPAKAGKLETRVRAIFKAQCLKCHSGAKPKGQFSLSTREDLVRGGETGRVITPGKPLESLLFQHVQDGSMPPGEDKRLSGADLETLKRWIESGAPFGKGGRLPTITTQHDVYPILQLRCVVCHGGRTKQAKLDLRSRESILRGGKSGPAVVLGKPENSLLLKKIHDGSMPPRRDLVAASIKVIEPAEIEKLARWIGEGMPLVPDPPTSGQVPVVSDEQRKFWAFQQPLAASVPAVNSGDRVRNPIDAFLLKRLEARGLSFSPDADRLSQLRRATVDVTGLPPRIPETRRLAEGEPQIDSLETWQANSVGDSLGDWDRQVDRLLASPHFGARWARFWLDLAGYSDSDGIQNADPIRRSAYRYRDYVIRSFNDDKPYNRFLLEQIAGDELADYRRAKVVTEQMADNLVATGFLRFVPDATYANITGFVPDRRDVIDAELEVLTSAVMGLTLKCAKCHYHKFDPLPQRDYYRLAAVFKGALDENDWLKPYGTKQFSSGPIGFRHMSVVSTREQKAVESHNAGIEAAIATARTALSRRATAARQKQVEARLEKLPAVIRDDVRKALATEQAKRSPVAGYLAEKFASLQKIDDATLKKLDPAYAKSVVETDKRVKELGGQKREQPFVRALWDRGSPSPTYVLIRGNYLTPGRKVEPGVPEVLAPQGFDLDVQPPFPDAESTGRRLAFGRWLTADEHPLTARIIVNRIWKYYFGRGIVATLDNFGETGERPTHPELLDWLAVELVRNGWRMKPIHRLILNSTAYRQSSALTDRAEKLDPENLLLSRMPLKRLDAESLRDSLLAVSGELDTRQFGPGDAVSSRADGLVTAVRGPRGWRRSIFLLQRRTQISTLLQNFDLPRMSPNCIQRPISIVAPQALHLLNNKAIRELADRFAERVEAEVGDNVRLQATRVFRIALARVPNHEELAACVGVLQRLRNEWAAKLKNDQAAANRRALGNLCHAVMNSAAFMYLD